MSKRQRVKYKIDRRMRENIWGRSKSPFNKRNYGPGQHGQRRSKVSDFCVQLHNKQKLKGYYGSISEKQFKRIYKDAVSLKGDTSENIIGFLERRLDAVVYRAKFVPTVFSARQFVNHGHVIVNGSKVNIPSYRVKVGDRIEVKKSSRQFVSVMEAVASNERDVPPYIEADHDNMSATFLRVPSLGDVPYPVQMNPQSTVEFYSR